MSAAKSRVSDEQVVRHLLDLQDKLRLIEATASTAMNALISEPYDKREGDVAHVLLEHVSHELDDTIRNLRKLVHSWGQGARETESGVTP